MQPWRKSALTTRWRAAVRTQRRSSRQRTRSRRPSWRGVGGATKLRSPCTVEAHRLLGVTAVGLHPVSGPDWDQGGRDHVTGDSHAAQQAVERIAARAPLIGDSQGGGGTRPADEAADRPLGVLDATHLRRTAACRRHTCHERVLVNVENDPSINSDRALELNVWHGLVLLHMRLWPQRSLTTAKLTCDLCERRGPAPLGVHAD